MGQGEQADEPMLEKLPAGHESQELSAQVKTELAQHYLDESNTMVKLTTTRQMSHTAWIGNHLT